MNMFFIGVDLAWSERNSTGVAIIKSQKGSADFVCGTSDIYENSAIVDYIMAHTRGDHAFIAIDASLVVKNKTGEREAETRLKKMFAKYHAVPYPSNRDLFYRLYGGVRGEQITEMLEQKGFQHSPYIKKFEKSHKFFEVFPHSAMVVIFQLEQVLKYKARKKRSYTMRWQEFERYQGYLSSLQHRKPSLNLPYDILKTDVRALRGKALKRYEDLLDAVFCAYIAFYYWYEPEKCLVIGDLNDGYIVTPVFA
ncbi:MAG: DUF429 domain-containing protein [Candidatus Aminicenantes bacterium]|nr:DUF429 domain-containing protein [Candidatus Aminicenantes bacterium]NIM83958.1 DUF429 domain-containing protein [Candidatus Aminicenantes bacterium]NIN23427.1 DUF429 domain-containing protein [Candidatus Aminicenantes bacterium]NIN47131.1 DUF429 domain-containing protein [Candidatus Aminicenantes bacterium]NIN90055.1 DUF429 domain-containing protein [Candidatus Aminicenantes bacterium]